MVLHHPPAGIPPVDDLTSMNWAPLLDRRPFRIGDDGTNAGAWLRVVADLGDDAVLQACALAYASDDMPTEAAIAAHPRAGNIPEDFESFMAATLDHTVWFHRPLQATDWHVHTFQGQGLTGGRGLALGRVYDGDGLHVATVAQEVVVRERRDESRS